jgi:hypothetical protein
MLYGYSYSLLFTGGEEIKMSLLIKKTIFRRNFTSTPGSKMPPKLTADAARRPAQKALDAVKLKKPNTALKVDIESVAVKKTVKPTSLSDKNGLGTTNTYSNALFGGGTECRMQTFHNRWLTEYRENFGIRTDGIPMEDPAVSPVSGILTPTSGNNLRKGINAALKEQKDLEVFAKKLSHTNYSNKELKDLFMNYNAITTFTGERTPGIDMFWDYRDPVSFKYLLKKPRFGEIRTNLELLMIQHGKFINMESQHQELFSLYSSYLAQLDCDKKDESILQYLKTTIRTVKEDGLKDHKTLLKAIARLINEEMPPLNIGMDQIQSGKSIITNIDKLNKAASFARRAVETAQDPEKLLSMVTIAGGVAATVGKAFGK